MMGIESSTTRGSMEPSRLARPVRRYSRLDVHSSVPRRRRRVTYEILNCKLQELEPSLSHCKQMIGPASSHQWFAMRPLYPCNSAYPAARQFAAAPSLPLLNPRAILLASTPRPLASAVYPSIVTSRIGSNTSEISRLDFFTRQNSPNLP